MILSSNYQPFITMNNRGFSLIELLVVLTILGILATVVAPRVMKHVGTAKSGTAKLQINEISAALDLYYLETSSYPTTKEGLISLVQQPNGINHWNGPYLKKRSLPLDPWNNAYHYSSPGQYGPYDLYSFGKDNKAGGVKEDKDIQSWE